MANLYGYNTSSAHKLESYSYSSPGKKPSGEKTLEKRQKKQEAAKKKNRALKNIAATLKLLAVFGVAFAIINGYVAINEANSGVAKLKKEYETALAENQDLQAKIDKAIDPKQLQSIAGEKFGMVRPERYQMFYIDMNQEDVSENIANSEIKDEKQAVAASGVLGTVIGKMKLFK